MIPRLQLATLRTTFLIFTLALKYLFSIVLDYHLVNCFHFTRYNGFKLLFNITRLSLTPIPPRRPHRIIFSERPGRLIYFVKNFTQLSFSPSSLEDSIQN